MDGQPSVTTVRDRKYRPRFKPDIAKATAILDRAQMAEHHAMVEIIGVDQFYPSHSWYFRCYDRVDVHRTMINDSVRTGSYLLAIGRNKQLFRDKTILDVGAGTSILSVFAVKEGHVKQAIAVDASAIALCARQLVKSSQLEDRVTIIRDKIENITELPVSGGLVDVIVAEWMGYGLFNESVLESVITARKRFLADGGLILPDTTSLKLLGSTVTRERPIDYKVVEDQQALSAVAPIDLTLLPAVEDYSTFNASVVSNQVLTTTAILKVIDMYTAKLGDLYVKASFTLTCESHGWFRSFVLFFDVLFDLPNSWAFSTGPDSPYTHWQQTVCALPPGDEFEVWRDTVISGTVQMKRIPTLPRFWTAEVNYKVTWKKRPSMSRRRIWYLL